jgi:hypothetical protein
MGWVSTVPRITASSRRVLVICLIMIIKVIGMVWINSILI